MAQKEKQISVDSKLKLKTKINNYIKSGINEHIGIEILEKFMAKYYILFATTFTDSINGVKPLKRRIIIYCCNALDWIMFLRFALITIIDEPWIWILFGYPFYSWGKGRHLSAIITFFGTDISTLNTTFLVFDEKQ